MIQKIRNLAGIILIMAGIGLLLFPEISSLILDMKSDQTVSELKESMKKDNQKDTLYEKSLDYNEKIQKEDQTGLMDAWSYQAAPIRLKKEKDTFGYVKIPKMKVKLPLYLGATLDHLKQGAAILGQTSLPLGEKDSNCVIAAHRGYQGIPYFREIEQLQNGDTIIVRNPWEILRYQVVDIKIIQPYESDKIRIQKGKDMVTLLTCHPYRGHGKYRYVVYCERNHGQTATGKKEKKISDSSKDEIRKEEMIRYGGVLLLILLLGVRIRKMKKRS